ncbi:DNA-processing protein DprA [Rhodococcus sp. RD6.2]|uniref:DNA-processing protein DprA n=1 Tax=Rhodococcus sp. RD6.2 TaxID=260936 RepID=UPI000679BB64|nr:DNA-processing protein DprA [Rhodococcus sp. RD6.2]
MECVNEAEAAVLIALLHARPRKMSWSAIASEVALRGSATALWDECFPPTLEGVNDLDGHLARAWESLEAWRSEDFKLLTVLDGGYPSRLREIHQVPPIVFVRGQLRDDEVAVSVVGSRRASDRGRAVAARIAEGLVDRGIAVLSGLAEGIDAAAHTATLKAGGRPIGVIGTGINRSYPAGNRTLQAEVAKRGAVVSQFWPDAPPQKHSFPMRNATMSGLGRASIVVEAGEHSGARIQARLAVEHGRPVILTDMVVGATTWARDLLTRPGVYLANSTAELMDLVDQLTQTAAGVDDWSNVLPDLVDH